MKRKEELERLLVIVDMVNGFIREGNMADKYIEHIIPDIKHLMNENTPLAFIKDTHEENSSEFKKFPVHCLRGSSESKLIDEFKPYEKSSLVYEKNSTSTIFAKNFLQDINKMKKLKEVIICGCCSDICILNLAIPLTNYFDQYNQNTDVLVAKNAIETFDSPFHNRGEYNQMSLCLMKQAGVKII